MCFPCITFCESRCGLFERVAIHSQNSFSSFVPVIQNRLNGIGLFPFTLPFAAFAVLWILSSFAGPTLGAYVVTGIIEGKPGVRQLLRRYIQWQVGVHWYLIALFGFSLLPLLGIALVDVSAVLNGLAKGWPLIFTSFLPLILTFNFIIPLGEEPGWRGFALPRLQKAYGPLLGSIILGTLHGLWHLPAFFIGGVASLGSFNILTFGLFLASAIAATMFFTWVFNNTGGSLLLAILLHAGNERSSDFVQQIVPNIPKAAGLWVQVVFFRACVLLLILTRGRLSYRPAQAAPAQEAPRSEQTAHPSEISS